MVWDLKVALFGHHVDALASQIATCASVCLVDDPLLKEYSPGGYLQALQAVTMGPDPPLAILLAHSSS